MNNSNTPLVSVVTPAYNGEKYLAECIESVLDQTYQNWEYVIVNNKSKDNTLQIAQKYADRDARIKVYTNDDFLKQIPNWNEALQKISPDSKYCKEIHADDCLMPECIEKMVAKAEEYPTAGIVSSYRFVGPEVGSVFGKGLSYKTTFMTGKEAGREFLLNGLYLFGSPTTILYRSNLIRARDSFYEPNLVHADTDICLDILRSSDFAFVPQLLSFTRLHDESTTNFADYYNTSDLYYLYALKKYGDFYLTDQEYKNQLSYYLKLEHRWLLKSIFKGRAKEVWPYHKKELGRLGLSIKKLGLLKAFFTEISKLFRTDKVQAIKNRVAKISKRTSTKEDTARKKIIKEKKRDTVSQRN